jgi:hypothetical protein
MKIYDFIKEAVMLFFSTTKGSRILFENMRYE